MSQFWESLHLNATDTFQIRSSNKWILCILKERRGKKERGGKGNKERTEKLKDNWFCSDSQEISDQIISQTTTWKPDQIYG